MSQIAGHLSKGRSNPHEKRDQDFTIHDLVLLELDKKGKMGSQRAHGYLLYIGDAKTTDRYIGMVSSAINIRKFVMKESEIHGMSKRF